jgi:hypothetical protein
MDSQMISMMPYLVCGGFALMALIIVPTMIRKSRNAIKKSRNFLPDLCARTGLSPYKDNGVAGMYKGYQVQAFVSLKSGYVGRDSGSRRNARPYPALKVMLTDPKVIFPNIALYDRNTSWQIDSGRIEYLKQKEPRLPLMEDVDASSLHKEICVFGTDRTDAEVLIRSAELKQALVNWYYPDIRFEGKNVIVSLDNEMTLSKYGDRLSDPSYIIQAMDMGVAAANALKKG